MQARLTFATAVSVRPDVFIVDEALATGDLLFQEKCLRKMRLDLRERGDGPPGDAQPGYHVYEMCDACLLIGDGRVLAPGRTADASARPTNASCGRPARTNWPRSGPTNRPRPGPAKSSAMEMHDRRTADRPRSCFMDRPYRVGGPGAVPRGRPTSVGRVPGPDRLGHRVIGDTTVGHGVEIDGPGGDRDVVVTFEFTCRLAGGSYLLGGGVSEIVPGGATRNLHFVRGARSRSPSRADR